VMLNLEFLPLDGGGEVEVKGYRARLGGTFRLDKKTLTPRAPSGFLAFACDWRERGEIK